MARDQLKSGAPSVKRSFHSPGNSIHDFSGLQVGDGILRQVGPEPVHAEAARQGVCQAVVFHGRRIEEEAAVEAARGGAKVARTRSLSTMKMTWTGGTMAGSGATDIAHFQSSGNRPSPC